RATDSAVALVDRAGFGDGSDVDPGPAGRLVAAHRLLGGAGLRGHGLRFGHRLVLRVLLGRTLLLGGVEEAETSLPGVVHPAAGVRRSPAEVEATRHTERQEETGECA